MRIKSAAVGCLLLSFGSSLLMETQWGGFPTLRANPGPIRASCHFTAVLEHALSLIEANDTSVDPWVVHKTEDFVALYDGFPKSSVHLLIIPRERILSLAAVTPERLPLLQKLAAYVNWIMECLREACPTMTFVHGLHSVPSLRQLHVHVLSQDFQSPCLKNAKHFNSFQTPFFVSLDLVIEALLRGESIETSLGLRGAEERMKQQELQCPRCKKTFGRRFAELKKHLSDCVAALPVSSHPRSFLRCIDSRDRGLESKETYAKRFGDDSVEDSKYSKRSHIADDVVDLT